MSGILTGRDNPTILRQETTAVKIENLGGLTKRTSAVNAIPIPLKREFFGRLSGGEEDFSRPKQTITHSFRYQGTFTTATCSRPLKYRYPLITAAVWLCRK